MNPELVLKDATALIKPADGDSPHGEFDLILSAPTEDRDGETVRSDEWEPLPDHITMDVDHGMSVETTAGSGTPALAPDGTLRVHGTYASTPLGQTTRSLVNDGHIRTASVAFLRKSSRDAEGKPVVRRELLNGAFVAVPSNRESVILSSKTIAAKAGARNSAADAKTIQQIHDAAQRLGATCDPSGGDGDTVGDGAKAVKAAPVSDKPWSQFTAADYSPEQWRAACLIDTGAGDPDSKDRYKLPIKEPDGTLNRNAVHAAASVLAGGRGGVQAPAEQKAKAARALVAAYHQLREQPPDSLTSLAGSKSYAAKAAGATDDPARTAQAVDAALDEAMRYLRCADFDSLPEPVQQAIGLVQSAWESCAPLLEQLGAIDPDAHDSGTESDSASAGAAEAAPDADDELATRAMALRALQIKHS